MTLQPEPADRTAWRVVDHPNLIIVRADRSAIGPSEGGWFVFLEVGDFVDEDDERTHRGYRLMGTDSFAWGDPRNGWEHSPLKPLDQTWVEFVENYL